MSCKEPRKEILGLTRITKKLLLQLCRKHKLYQTPELNDVLYLHYQGFDCIECLEDYTELKCLWLECNAIAEIQGLDNQTKLKCLFLQRNLIRKIENLEFCKELDTLNLSENHIRKIENCGIEVLPVLNTLNLSSNYLKDCEGLKELENCKNLSVLDLSNNRIDDILVVKIFAIMPELKVLVLQGNPVVSKIPQYRKTLILECTKLTYLDSRPVFSRDRACAEAWKRGGYEEERKENERWNRKDRKMMRDSVNATIQLRNKNRKPEDQTALLPSSDSEDDTNKQKKDTRVRADSGAYRDKIWNEVAEDRMSDEPSNSDISADSRKSVSNQSSESGGEESIDIVVSSNESYEIIGDHQIREEGKIPKVSEKSLNNVQEPCGGLEENTPPVSCTVDKLSEVSNYSDSHDMIIDKESSDITTDTSIREKEVASEICQTSLNIEQESNGILERNTHSDIFEQFEVTHTTESDIVISKKESYELQNDQHIEEAEKINKMSEDCSDKIQESSSTIEEVTLHSSLNDQVFQCNDPDIKVSDKASCEIINHQQIEAEEDIREMPQKFLNNLQESGGRLEEGTLHSILDACEHLQANCTESNMGHEANFETTIKAIEKISKSENVAEFVYENRYEDIDDAPENDGENYEPLKELEENMSIFNENVTRQQSSSKFDTKAKILNQKFENEQTHLEVNKQVKADFEELSTNLSNFINQLEEDKQNRQEFMNAFFNTERAAKGSSSECSDNEEELTLEELKLERLINKWDNETKIKKANTQSEVMPTILNNEQVKSKENSGDKLINENNQPDEGNLDQDKKPSECTNNKQSRVSFEYIPLDVSALTRKNDNAISLLEKESKELKEILQKLEDKNEKLFKNIEYEENCQTDTKNEQDQDEKREEKECNEIIEVVPDKKDEFLENRVNDNMEEIRDFILDTNHKKEDSFDHCSDDIQEDGKYNPNTNEEDLKKIKDDKFEYDSDLIQENDLGNKGNKSQYTSSITGESIKEGVDGAHNEEPTQISYIIIEEILHFVSFLFDKPKSYEFPSDLSEGYEEYNFSYKKLAQVEEPPKSIHETVESFNKVFNQYKVNNQERQKVSFKELHKNQNKIRILTESSSQANLKQLNEDSVESLDAQLKVMKKHKHARVRRIVERVYANKDRYDDELELVDGKLMIRNKNTNELYDLPKPPEDLSDNEDDYDTPQSEEEDKKFYEYLRKEQFKQKLHKEITSGRKSSEDLVIRALIQNTQYGSHDESEESDGELPSSDGHDERNLLSIDKEFLNKLTVDFSNLTKQDENHIVQCTRSYEELKHCLTLSEKERHTTEEENELLEDMNNTKCGNSNESRQVNLANSFEGNNDLSKEEQLWFNRNVLGFERKKAEDGYKSPCYNVHIEKMVEKTLLKCFSVKEDSDETLNTRNYQESFSFFEEHRVEEKNEIEYNIDFENGASNEKILDGKELRGFSKPKLYSTDGENIEKFYNVMDTSSFGVGQILYSNLETISENDEIMDANSNMMN